MTDKGVAIVSGAASGLGRSVSERLSEVGYSLVLIDRQAEALQEFARDINAHALCVDLTDAQAVERELLVLDDWQSRPSVLVNCAGVCPASCVLKGGKAADLALFTNVIAINLIATFNLIRLCAARMRCAYEEDNTHHSVIINTASISAFEGQIGQVAYAASKAGIVGMTLPLARELARYHIRVMTLAPGVMKTPLVDKMPAAVQQSLQQNIPLPKRFGRPDEFAALVLHIIENQYLNGEVIRLDGGLRMS